MPGATDRLAKRREELKELRQRRDKMELQILEERLLGICKSLEERILRVERAISQGLPRGKETNVNRAASGTELASNLDEMLPDIPANLAAPAMPAAGATKSPSRPAGPARPSSFAKLGDLSKDSAYFLSGAIREATLPDILQLVSSNDKTGVFVLEHGGKHINLYFRDGHLYHAQSENISGQSAFFAAMALSEGRFFFKETDEVPEEKTIDGNTQFMILEALRQIDEERSGE